ncbi:DUF1998 domain-containing protein [Tomitella fengzijianii]|uniref:DUF1998 domain-containing protein n=1 Tax=Tomitella fengzijianii TaxID=2597660 RepID=UPI001F2FD5A6|nr:DUF1998 domain-containing protein [Tomitella fengzijianii]
MGGVRQSQVVTTYGVGSMVAVESESFIVGGIDTWDDTGSADEVYEQRLARILGVRGFRLPPAPDPERGRGGVTVFRFPEFYSCPECFALQRHREFNPPPGKSVCSECNEDLIPSRFVLACENGHIEDFPYWKWVHRGVERESGFCKGELRLRTAGASASLRSVIVECSCGVPPVSMEGAFRTGSLRDLGIRCEGRRPWLERAQPELCDKQPRTMQRGSSSAWHPVIHTALSIPPWGEGVYALVERCKLVGKSEEYIRTYLEDRPALLSQVDTTVQGVIDVARAFDDEEGPAGADAVPTGPRSRLREDEYVALVRGRSESRIAEWQPFVCEPPAGDPSAIEALGLVDTMLVKRLREVRVMASFTRGQPPEEGEEELRHAQLSLRDDIDWLPAMEVIGEGVFLRLDERRLTAWESEPSVVRRAEHVRTEHERVLRERAKPVKGRKATRPAESHVTARLLLLHTLAHAVINEWSLDAGYPASALRERIYSGPDMAGILIYTATSDSAGSLGGIIAHGEPENLSRTLRSALARAQWCSNDPLCMESQASGSDSLNKAACHACVLLPETSCESLNSFLDRAMIVGDHAGDVRGYFSL